MTNTREVLALLGVGLGLLAGCGDGGGKKQEDGTRAFDGTWVVCRNDDGSDYRERFVISGTSLVTELLGYQTTDVTCDGDATPLGSVPAVATYGVAVAVPFDGGTVNATQVDLALGGETFYTLVYRDVAASPDALYLGGDSDVLDGSTPELRPDRLQALARTLQVEPVAADLTGTWAFCPVGGPGDGARILRFDAAARTFVAEKYSGACGDGLPWETRSGTFTFADPVMVSLGGRTVTAFAVDITFGDNLVFYTTFWVDREASPRRLHRGDDGLHGMNGTNAAQRPRVLSDQAFVKQP